MDCSGSHPRYPRLFEPLRIKGITLRNRTAISGHLAYWYIGPGGLPSDELAAYIEERAKGGIGLFVIGSNVPVSWGHDWLHNTSDAVIPRYKIMAEAGHRHGAKVFAQLCHPGYFPLPGTPRHRHSPIAVKSINPGGSGAQREQPDGAKIQELVRAFGAAAGRVKAGGLDGVELHAHEFFLHAQFLSPVWNTRSDEYGGPLENRLRFIVETLRAMRAAVGEDFVVGIRLKADDKLEGGMSVGDYKLVLARLEELKLVDYVNFSGGDANHHHGPMPRPEGEWLPLLKELKSVGRLPLMHAGRLMRPELAEQALQEGLIDVAVMTKAHIADGRLVRKAWEGREEDIRWCTRCLQSCLGGLKVTCVYNPVTSREKDWAELRPAARRRKVVVVGAGPAGMEAALISAQRGHEVVVLEKADRVGGQVWLGAASPLRKPWARIAEFYQRQAAKGLFEVRLGAEATPESLLALGPEVVVLATGSRPRKLEIPGGPAALTVHEALSGAAAGAKRALIFDREGFNRPIVAADLLSSQGVAVDFVTSQFQVGSGLPEETLEEFFGHLKSRGVRFWPGMDLAGWNGPGRLLARDIQSAHEKYFEGLDCVVATVGSEPFNPLAAQLEGRVKELHVIGDASSPQTVELAVYQGGLIARKI